jgi:hypothetical protein
VSGGGRDGGAAETRTEGMRGGAVGPTGCASSRGSSVTCTRRDIGASMSHRR